MNKGELWRLRGQWGSSNGGDAEGGGAVSRKGGNRPGSPHGPYTWGNGPNARKGTPKSSGGDGCAVTALALAGGLLAAVAGAAYGLVQAAQSVF